MGGTIAALVVLDRVRDEWVYGRTLVERHLEQLRRAGVEKVAVVSDGASAAALERSAWFDAGDRCLVVDGAWLLDLRIYQAVLSTDGLAVAPAAIEDARGRRPLAVLPGPQVKERLRGGVDALGGWIRESNGSTATPIDTLPTYSPELRRRLRPYALDMSDPGDRRHALGELIRASGKGRQDLPVVLFNRPVEQLAMRLVAPTRVSPDVLTIVTNVVAVLAGVSFYKGALWTGVLLAIAVGVLDGLDGRQARIQLRHGRLAQVEHVLDALYEMAWWVALGAFFSRGREEGAPLVAAALWVAFYLADRLAYDVFKARAGRHLDEVSDVDGLIRLIGGRRNVYVFMLLGGVLMGMPYGAFLSTVWWAGATAAAHWLRVATLMRRVAR